MTHDSRKLSKELGETRAELLATRAHLQEARASMVQFAAAYIGLYADVITYAPDYVTSPNHAETEQERDAAMRIIVDYADLVESQAPGDADAPTLEPVDAPAVPRRYCHTCGESDSVMFYHRDHDLYYCRNCRETA